jgi:hypothetical protein
VEGLDVVQLEVDLEERLPVDGILVDGGAVVHVVRVVELGGHREAGQVGSDVAGTVEQQAVPILQGSRREVEARKLAEMRCRPLHAVEVVGPAVDGADDVLRRPPAFVHYGLAVATDIGDEVDTVSGPHQHPGVVHPAEDMEVARVGHHPLLADVPGADTEHVLALHFENSGIHVPRNRELQRRVLPVLGRLHRACSSLLGATT